MNLTCQKCRNGFEWEASDERTLHYRLCRQVFSVKGLDRPTCPHCGAMHEHVAKRRASTKASTVVTRDAVQTSAKPARVLKNILTEETTISKRSFVGLLVVVFLLSVGMYRMVFVPDADNAVASVQQVSFTPPTVPEPAPVEEVKGIHVADATEKGDAPTVHGLDQSNPDSWMDYIATQMGDELSNAKLLPKNARLTSGFGYRIDPISKNAWRFHHGLDIAMKRGTPVKTLMPGKVVFAGYAQHYGNVVFVEHPHGLVTIYGHLARTLVKEGDQIDRLQLIGKVGSTGRSTGPHLHFEVRLRNKKLDPSMIPQFKFLTKAKGAKKRASKA